LLASTRCSLLLANVRLAQKRQARILSGSTNLSFPRHSDHNTANGCAFMANEEHLRAAPVWKADWIVTAGLAESLIETFFPSLKPASIRQFAAGWDNTVFLVNDSFIFRFPRRRIAVCLMETEVRLLPWLASQLPLPIPNPCYVGASSSDYPCVFAGYRQISGQTITAANVSDDERRGMARRLARFLAALHAISPDEARMRGAGPDPISRLYATRHKPTATDRLDSVPESMIPRSLKARLRYLLDALPTIKEPSSGTLVHGDLHGSQLLVSEDAHELAGVIDWGDVHLGDPASDFAVVHSMLPRDCHRDFLEVYGPVEPISWAAAKARAIWHTIAVVIQAVDVGDAATIREAQSCFKRLAED